MDLSRTHKKYVLATHLTIKEDPHYQLKWLFLEAVVRRCSAVKKVFLEISQNLQ